jgi:antitoxin FitA
LHSASIDVVTTLYIRDVSDEVAQTLKERAAAAGMSLSAYVAGELERIAARPTNAEIVQRLKVRNRSAGPSTAEIVEAVRDSRR